MAQPPQVNLAPALDFNNFIVFVNNRQQIIVGRGRVKLVTLVQNRFSRDWVYAGVAGVLA